MNEILNQIKIGEIFSTLDIARKMSRPTHKIRSALGYLKQRGFIQQLTEGKRGRAAISATWERII